MGKIVGEKLLPYVANQIEQRQLKHGLISRDVEALTYLNSKTAWLKLASAVEITPERLAKEEFRSGFAWNKLAKDYVLFGGISHLEGDKLEQLQSILFSGNSDGMYDVSASDKQAREFGLVPMPGLESAEVKSLNRGSIKEANITIKCYSPEQFRILDLLYLRIGYTLFLEWGWGTYFDNNGKLETNYFSLIEDPSGFFNSSWKKKSYLPFLNKIEATREAKDGNYDGLLCRVTNFSWTFNNGVYDINLKCISLGDVVESLKTNITPSYDVSKFIEDQYAIFQDGEETEANKGISPSPVNNVISAYIFLQKIFLLSNANNGGDKYYKLREVPHKAKGFPKEETMSLGSVFIKPGDVDGGLTYSVNDQLFKNHSQRDEFIKERLSGGIELDEGLLGNPINILNEKTQPGIYYVKTNAILGERNRIYYKIIPDLTSLNAGNRQDTDVFFLNYNNMVTDEDVVLDEGFYFRFGHILELINEKIITRIASSNEPLLGIDSGQWSNYMYTFPYQVSLDPRICLVKNPSQEPINSKEFIISAASWKDPEKFDYAWTMNIYLNGKFITDTISNNIDENGDISLFSFLSTICTELNKALGGVNNLEPVIDEDENKIYIIDGSYSETEKPSGYQLELYGYNGKQSNFVKDVSIKTELTNDFATMATVGSTAGGYVKGVENTMFSKWNKGLIDRFKEKLVPANPKSNEKSQEDRDEPHEAYVKEFWNRVYSPFGVTSPQDIPDDFFTQDQPALNNEIIDKNIAIVTEFYKYCHSVIQSKYEKYASPTNGFIPISLNATFDGLSGIKIYNAINADTRFLPPNYPDALKFIIKGVNHKISQNNWDTTIDTVVIANNVNEKGAPILPYDNLKNEVKTIIAGGKALATEDSFATTVKDIQRTIVETFSPPQPGNAAGSTTGIGYPVSTSTLNFANKYTRGLLPAKQHTDGTFVIKDGKKKSNVKDRHWLTENPEYIKILQSVNIPTSSGSTTVKVHPDFASKLNSAFSDIKNLGLQKYISSSQGGLAVRNVTGGTRLSNHSYGFAIDVNASNSGWEYGAKWDVSKKTITTSAGVTRNWNDFDIGFYEITKIMKKYGIGWLGNSDPMHFSIYE
jgi:hypothetical protein